MLITSNELISEKSSDFEYEGHPSALGCGLWRWYRGVGRMHMNRRSGRKGERR
jgi:hypothetical protein